jgi:hypothetical protein
MRKEELQKKLDERKWLESEKVGTDKSGDMPYCYKCNYQNPSATCSLSQEYRETNCLCARAYKK